MGETKMLKTEKAGIEEAKTILDIYNDSNKVFGVVTVGPKRISIFSSKSGTTISPISVTVTE